MLVLDLNNIDNVGSITVSSCTDPVAGCAKRVNKFHMSGMKFSHGGVQPPGVCWGIEE